MIAALSVHNAKGGAEKVTFLVLQIFSSDCLIFLFAATPPAIENTGFSFVVGYGKNGGPLRPYHKASSCPSKPKKCGWKEKNSEDPNPQPLYGALVSGPNILDEFKDDRSDFQHSAVGLTNNAGFTGLVAGIYDLELDGITLEDKVSLHFKQEKFSLTIYD